MAQRPSSFVSSYLNKLGLESDESASQSIGDLSGDRVVIGDDPADLPFTAHIVKSRSLKEIKSWIGNSDDTVRAHNIAMPMQKDLASIDPSQADHETLAHAAKRFVYGDSSAVSSFLDAIDDNLGPFELLVVSADTITIRPGQTLVFDGNTPKVVVADELIFDGAGANIESYVHLSMSIGKVVVK